MSNDQLSRIVSPYMQSLRQIIHDRFSQPILQETLLNVYAVALDKETREYIRRRHDEWIYRTNAHLSPCGDSRINLRGFGYDPMSIPIDPFVFWFDGEYDHW